MTLRPTKQNDTPSKRTNVIKSWTNNKIVVNVEHVVTEAGLTNIRTKDTDWISTLRYDRRIEKNYDTGPRLSDLNRKPPFDRHRRFIDPKNVKRGVFHGIKIITIVDSFLRIDVFYITFYPSR